MCGYVNLGPKRTRTGRCGTQPLTSVGAYRYGRGYLAVAVSVLHPGTLRFKPVQRSTSPGVAGTPIRRGTTAHFRALERTIVYPRDAPISRFVMMGSGVRIPLAAPILSEKNVEWRKALGTA
jgi:hypothetical protein